MKTVSTSSSRPSALSSPRPARISVRVCPTCGSSAIKEVVEDWVGETGGKRYVVPALAYFSCPTCGERVYPPDSMRRIQEASPAYRHPRQVRKSA